jgi:hypothetical protein
MEYIYFCAQFYPRAIQIILETLLDYLPGSKKYYEQVIDQIQVPHCV